MTEQAIWALGPAGTNGHQAAVDLGARLHLQAGISFTECHGQIFEKFPANGRDIGVVPIENATAGLVSEVVQFWLRRDRAVPFSVIGETWLPIRHHLLMQPGSARSDLSCVCSHEQALRQCEPRLSAMGVLTRAVKSTAHAAHAVRESRDPTVGALASALAADVYGLQVVEEDLQGVLMNETHFFALGVEGAQPTGEDKTAIMFQTPHQPGALDRVVHAVAEAGVNMHAIHSIGLGSREQYAFYAELSGHRDDSVTRMLLGHIRSACERLVILGSYPRWNG